MHRRFLLLSSLALVACTPINTPTNIIDRSGSYLGPDSVTDVSATNLGGTVIYDEVIPFQTTFQPPGGGPAQFSAKGAVQSRVVVSSKTGNYIFYYRFRDLMFNPAAPQQSGSQFIEIVSLSGIDSSLLPIRHFDIATSQSLGGEEWGGPVNLTLGSTIGLEWNSFFNKPDGTTFTALETTTRKFKTGKFLSLGDQAFGSATLDKIAIPSK